MPYGVGSCPIETQGFDDQPNYRKIHVALRKIAGYACLGCGRARIPYSHLIG